MLRKDANHDSRAGFTLVETGIVLVIVGLIAGGIVVGRELIHAASIRAQVTDFGKYDAAVCAFKTKYNAIPGDLPPSTSTAFGFAARIGGKFNGDSNGAIEDMFLMFDADTLDAFGNSFTGESILFWNDLATAQLLNHTFDMLDATINTDHKRMFPPTRIGKGYVFAFSDNGAYSSAIPQLGGLSYVTLTIDDSMTLFNFFGSGSTDIRPFSRIEAYAIDRKTDDGRSNSGGVRAQDPQNGAGYGFLTEGIGTGDTADCSAAGNYLTNSDPNRAASCALRVRASACL